MIPFLANQDLTPILLVADLVRVRDYLNMIVCSIVKGRDWLCWRNLHVGNHIRP